MSERMPPEGCPDDDALERWVHERRGDPGTVAHLDACAVCQARLAIIENDDRFLSQVRDAVRPVDDHPAPPEPTLTVPGQPRGWPERIDGFTVRRVIASGGMGTVFEAVQEHPRRVIALKVMRPGVASPTALRRFQYEAQTLARLHHPGIAQIYAAGTHDDGGGGVPYFAMEYIPNARSIDAYVVERGLDVRARLKLFIPVCDAVQHGHGKGIIHRDLKPSNILVDANGTPKVIDFGVARATDSDLCVTPLQTVVGQLVGTVQYMSPEQCEADPQDLDTRSDVYALGVVLYEILSGRPAYEVGSSSLIEAVQAVRTQAPPTLGTLDPALRGDVETIVAKAMAKDRDRRYRTAAELGEDLARYLAGRTITARPPTLAYQMRMFARRHRVLVAGAAVVALVLTLGVIGTSWGWRQAVRARESEARQAAGARDVVDFLTEDLLATVDPRSSSRPEITFLDAMAAATEHLAGRFDEAPDLEASIRTELGNTYNRLHDYERAKQHLTRAVALREAAFGAEAVETTKALNGLAWAKWHVDEPSDTAVTYRALLEIESREYGDDDERTLVTRSMLAWVEDRFDEAAALLERILAERRRRSGLAAEDTLSALSRLETLYAERLDRGAEAEALLLEAIEALRTVHHGDDASMVPYLGNLANMYRRQDRLPEAVPLYERIVAVTAAARGEDDERITLEYEWRLAGLYRQVGRADDAAHVHASIVDRLDRGSGRSEKLQRSLAALVELALEQSRPEDAAAWSERALVEARRGWPAEDPQVGRALLVHGRALAALDRFDEAEAALDECRRIREHAANTPKEDAEELSRALAALYIAWGRPEEAARWSRGATP